MMFDLKQSHEAGVDALLSEADDEDMKAKVMKYAEEQGWLPADHIAWRFVDGYSHNRCENLRICYGSFHYESK